MTHSATFSACPKCGSHDVKYLSVMFEAGINTTHKTTKHRSGNFDASSVTQNQLSKRAVPPGKKSFRVCIIFAVIALALFGFHVLGVGAVALIIAAYFGYTAFIFNSRVWPAQYQVWQQSAMCQRCGSIYIPNEAGITLDVVSTKEVMAEHQRKLAGVAQPLLNRAQEVSGQVARGAAQKAEEIRAQRTTTDSKQADIKQADAHSHKEDGQV